MALMIVHSASVSSKCGLGIMKCDSGTFSTSVEVVKGNIYICKDRGSVSSESQSKPEIRFPEAYNLIGLSWPSTAVDSKISQ